MSRLLFHVCHCWSEEDGFPGRELQFHTAETRGWNSARFPQFPVELGLQFEGLVSIKSVNLLSHEFKIATRVDVMVCEPGEQHLSTNMFPPYNQAQWRRLGHFCFGSNEDKQFKARELKTVHLNASTVYLRLLLGKCHLNPYNFYNQVSLMAVEVFGEMVQPLRLLTPIRAPKVKEVDLKALRPPASMPAGGPPGASALDPVTAQKIKDLEAQKTIAVQNEEYDVAKQLKVKIDALKNVASRLQQLETDKRHAIAQEDYDRAKNLKLEIEAVRRQALGITSQSPAPEPKSAPLRKLSSPRISPKSLEDSQPEAPLAVRDLFDEVPVGRATEVNHIAAFDDVPVGPSKKVEPKKDMEAILNMTDPFNLKRRSSMGPQPAPFGDQEGIGEHANGDGAEQGLVSLQLDAAGKPEWEVALFATLQELNGDSQWMPEEPHCRRADAQRYVEVFGCSFVDCLLARQWQLRELALKAIALHLIDQRNFGVSVGRVFEVCCYFLASKGHGLKEVVANVFFSACDLLEAMLHLETELSSAQLQAAIAPCLQELVTKSGDVNLRIKDVSLQLLKVVAQNPEFGPVPIYNAVVNTSEGSNKKTAWRTTLAKLYLIYLLMEAYGVRSETNASGLDTDSIMTKLVLPGLQNPNAEVRQEAIEIIALLSTQLLDHVTLDSYLVGLKPALLATIEQAIAKAREGAVSAPATMDKARQQRSAQADLVASIQELEAQIEQLPENFGERHERSSFGKEEEQMLDGEDGTGCPFCGAQDPDWDEAALDQHYGEYCPWLTACENCGQVIEIPFLHEHMATECEGRGHVDVDIGASANSCPLCGGEVEATLDPSDGWLSHLLIPPGCPSNPRPLDI